MFTIEERMRYIGGSDAAGVLGLSRWKTPLSIWAEKTGQIVPEDISGKLAIRFGTKAEQIVAEMFEEDTGKKVRKVSAEYTHKKYDFIKCHIDRKVEGEDSDLECKTCSARKATEWKGDEIPQEYIIQCYHDMACTGRKKTYLAVLIGNEDFKIKEILWDDKFISDIIQKEVDFWNNFIVTKTMPITTANDADTLFKLFPSAKEGTEISLPDSVNQIVEQIEAFSADKKIVEANLSRLQNELKAQIKENEVGNTGIYRVKWVNVHKDAHSVKASDYRMIRYSKIEKEK